jgi:uncharacterized protein (DUF1015 family)
MAHIVPFRAYRYDPSRVNLRDVVTQPYDKITPRMQERYYAASPYNLVRIILGKPKASDNFANNVYTRAADHFRTWRDQGVFRQDSQQSIYHYKQSFLAPGKTEPAQRDGFIALGKLEEYSAGVVFRHEKTLPQPKADRLQLLRATGAHFGQIFMLYSDPDGEIDATLAGASGSGASLVDEFGVTQELKQISEQNVISRIQEKMRDKKLIIADGHHRYETALAYRDEYRGAAGSGSQDEAPSQLAAGDFAMMTFVNMDRPGLTILPTHRVVRGLSSFSADEFRDKARAFFSVEEVDRSINTPRALAILREAGRAGPAILAVTADRAFLIDTPRSLSSNILDGFSLRQRSLDVVQLHRCLLEGVLNISEEAIREERNLRYLRDADEAMAQVRSGAGNVAFLMNPVRISQVRDLAFAGEVMPQKSTDFYPKLLSGLTICALD